jgi:hypothetical protein
MTRLKKLPKDQLAIGSKYLVWIINKVEGFTIKDLIRWKLLQREIERRKPWKKEKKPGVLE